MDKDFREIKERAELCRRMLAAVNAGLGLELRSCLASALTGMIGFTGSEADCLAVAEWLTAEGVAGVEVRDWTGREDFDYSHEVTAPAAEILRALATWN